MSGQARRGNVDVPEGMVLVNCAYRFRLDPSRRQERALLRHAGARRFAYNWGVAFLRDVRAIRAAELEAAKVAGVADPKPITRWPSFIELNNAFNAWKSGRTDNGKLPAWWLERHPDETPPEWIRENSSQVYLWALYELADALKDHFASLSEPRVRRWVKGPDGVRRRELRPRVEFPRFKSKKRDRPRFKVTGGKDAARPVDYTHVRLPVIGRVHTRESMKRLVRAINAGRATVKNVTVSRDTKRRWWVSFAVEELRPAPRPTRRMVSNGAVGVDLGVAHLATLSTGHLVANPRALGRNAQRLAALQKKIARSRKGSHNYHELRQKVAAVHARIAGLRRNHTHHLTTLLARSFSDIAIENLNVAGMGASARGSVDAPGVRVRQKAGLNRAIRDAAFSEIRRQLEYKTSWYGSTLHVVDRYEPTSQTCSVCGQRNPSLTLTERVYDCASCGVRLDRDHNAARNIHRLAVGRSAPAQGGHPVRLRSPSPALRLATVTEPLIGKPRPATPPPRRQAPAGAADKTRSPVPQGTGIRAP